MATTFLVFELGMAPVIDTVEGNLASENHAALNGLSFGSTTDPVSGNLTSLSPATDLLGLVTSYTGGATSDAYDSNNLLYNERFIIDGVTYTHDATMIYANTIITYTDGTTAVVDAMVMQDTGGNLYLLPPPTGPGTYSDALEAKPIASVTLGTATPVNGTDVYGMIADRYVLDLQDGVVAGTDSAELIDGSYAGDPQGDRVDDTDNMAGTDDDLILALGGDDTVLAGAGNDLVDGGDGNDRLQGDGWDDTILGGAGDDLILGDGPGTVDAVVVAHEDFSGGATGWTNPITTTDSQFGDFLGRFAGTNGDSSGGPLTEATFDLANGYGAVVIEFDLYLIDSWDADEPTWSVAPDGDAFQLYINGQQVANELFSSWDSAFFSDRNGTLDIAGVTYTYRFVLAETGTDLGGVSFNDQVWHVRLEATNYTADQITIGFGATTQPDINDESFGIDNLTIVSTNDTSIDIADAAGDDTLIGGAGNDTLQGGRGSDVMSGEAGSDTFVLENGFGDDTILGGEDSTGDDLDRLDVSAVTTNVTVSYTGDEAGTLTDGTHTASFAEIERITMGEGADLVDAALTTQGVTVTLLGGDDTMIGGLGNDSILAGAGNDSVSGGAGDDTINTRTTPGTGLPDESYPLAYGGDTDAFNDRDTVDGGFGNDLILTGDDNDIVLGGDGNDTIDAGFDDDIVDGGAGADWLEGNEGNDSIDAGAGDDVIYGDVAPDNPDYSLFAPFDLPNDDTDLAPANNADSLFGGEGNDTIYGQDDNDTLDGGAGDDLIVGGLDNDSLVGGDGNDTFVYAHGDGLDTIADFNFGNTGTLDDGDATNNDFIDLSGFYDNIAQLQDDHADDGILNQSNSGAVVWGQTVDYTDNARFASGDGIVLLGQTADGTSFTQENTGVVCFTPDTLILTERGERPVQSLRPGDRIVTRDNGVRPLQWLARRRIGQHALAADPRLRPVLLDPALTGAHTPLLVSPQHGVLLRPGDQDETLVRAIHLTRIEGRKARILDDLSGVTYFHLMFDAHQIVFANGAPSESFYPGPMALRALSEPARRELASLFPALFEAPSETIYGARARHFARFRDLPDHQNAFRAA